MPMVSLKLMAGAAKDMVVASARTTAAEISSRAMVSKEGPGGGPREAIPGARVESWVVGARPARACLPSARKARSKVGESAPVVSVTSRRHRVTAARWAGPRSRDLEGLSDPTSAHGAPPRAISAFAPLSGTPRLAAIMLHRR